MCSCADFSTCSPEIVYGPQPTHIVRKNKRHEDVFTVVGFLNPLLHTFLMFASSSRMVLGTVVAHGNNKMVLFGKVIFFVAIFDNMKLK